jgi:hypothetical protein
MRMFASTVLPAGVHRQVAPPGTPGSLVLGHSGAPGLTGADGAAPGATNVPDALTALRRALRASGGIARGEDLAHVMAAHRQGDYVSLARQIVDHEVLCFEWDSSHWVPMFQFDLHDLSIRPDLLPVFRELHDDCDGWALTTWFASANRWLRGRLPVDLLDTDLAAVLAAAQAGRQVETG